MTPSDIVLSHLIGLARTLTSHEATENTLPTMIHALRATARLLDEEEAAAIANAIDAEKFTMSPGCRHCAHPCGNTAPYDMNKLYDSPADERSAKLTVLTALQARAAEGKEPPIDLLQAGISLLSADADADVIGRFWNNLEKRYPA